MPLRHEPQLADVDLDTRILLSQVYVEACRELDTPSMSTAALDKLRNELGNRLVQLALAGERDPGILKVKALEELRRLVA